MQAVATEVKQVAYEPHQVAALLEALAEARVEVKLVAPPELVVELSGRPDLKLHAFSCVVAMEGSSVAELQAR